VREGHDGQGVAVIAPGIAVYSVATSAKPAEVQAWVDAWDLQMKRDFCPAWSRMPISVTLFADKAHIPACTPTLLVADECDDPQALAYHTEGVGGLITGLLGVGTCLDANESPCSAGAHEVLETARDPFCNCWVLMPDGARLVAAEVSDPVQASSYLINGFSVSNFVLPAWEDDLAPAGSRFDWLGMLSAPCTRSTGGYMMILDGGRVVEDGMRAAHKSKHALARGTRRRTMGQLMAELAK
jgi:hypothetical protein